MLIGLIPNSDFPNMVRAATQFSAWCAPMIQHQSPCFMYIMGKYEET